MTTRPSRSRPSAGVTPPVRRGGQAPLGPSGGPHPKSEQLARLGALELRGALDTGELTSAGIVGGLLERIDALDRKGPSISSILALSEVALEEAAARDSERRSGQLRGPLHGLPVLVKDNIDTAGPLGTTVGSLAMAAHPPAEDAGLVAALKDAGAIVVGKTNLSEWANFRSRPSSSGWSAVGGQTLNPYALNRSPGGSSSGTGSAVAAGFAPLGIGTETNGSILCPAAACGLVGLKPTVGLVSRAGIAPIASSQDTAGPMARSVADVALLLDVLAGTAERAAPGMPRRRPRQSPAYLEAARAGCKGLRVGIARDAPLSGFHPATEAVAAAALEALSGAGAEVVDPVTSIGPGGWQGELVVLCHEMKAGMNRYLARRAAGRRGRSSTQARPPRSLAELIEYNCSEPAERTDVFNQELLEAAEATSGLDSPEYRTALRRIRRTTRSGGIDAACSRYGIDAIAAPTMGPAWQIDHVNGDSHAGASWAPAAIAGYPSITVPVGLVCGLPVGLSLWGPAWSEEVLLRLAGSLERELGAAPVPPFASRAAVLA